MNHDGALATAAIEGNTLNEEQVAGIYRGEYTAPPSREYQEREVRNVLDALTPVLAALYAKAGPRTLSRDLNRLAKAGLILRDGRSWKANIDVMFTFMPPAAP